MRLMHVVCEICGNILFEELEFIAYKRKKPIEIVDLNGEQPWTGIGIVCKSCIVELADCLCIKGERERD